MANNKSRRSVPKSRARLSPLKSKNKTKTKPKTKSKSPPKNEYKMPNGNNFGNIPPPPQLRRY